MKEKLEKLINDAIRVLKLNKVNEAYLRISFELAFAYGGKEVLLKIGKQYEKI